ncbi:glycosyltransferase [Roseovarius sp. EL26]|uniref:glycosyltransferase n=1 Tax=Roseovarius sp. EL26 TaxID=2126672 RepID=UPI000EA1519C|nr:glycosyltransferase [Roseovarius sp. EL26]
MSSPYFTPYESRRPPRFTPMSRRRMHCWHLLAGMTTGISLWYLHWRWTQSLNPDALAFSIAVTMAESLFFLGSLLFYYDIWQEDDTRVKPPPASRDEAGLDGPGPIKVDLYITTYDEEIEVLRPSIAAARELTLPDNTNVKIFLLDDGNRPFMAQLAQSMQIGYLSRNSNEGFKAGNLRNALMQTGGDFILICDADTRVETGILQNTLGYFKNPKVAWVQTPHWFYDIPEGLHWCDWIAQKISPRLRWLAPLARRTSGRDTVGHDPFLSEPTLFFDVIQRRRNRHGASFCCGAGSIHRREAIFSAALKRKGDAVAQLSRKLDHPQQDALILNSVPLEPFRFHVSEDIYTSILLQEDADAWISVYHPQVEARMLSPWTVEAWAAQKLKYAGGTYDIMLHDNPLLRRGMPWRVKLHYAATFWSYITVLWTPVLLFAPVISLVLGIAPVKAYSIEFFLHFLPMILCSELAIVCACKGYAVQPGRLLALSTLPIQLRALWMVLCKRRPSFPPTPKIPVFGQGRHHILPNVWLLTIMGTAAIFGIIQTQLGVPGHDRSLLTVNLFWLGWNMLAVGRIVLAAFWVPPPTLNPKKKEELTHVANIKPLRQS